MRTRTSIYLDGQALHALDQRIVIQSINEEAAKLAPRAVGIGGHIGQRMVAMDRKTLDVDVRFCVLGARDTRGRAEVLERVAAWAHGRHVLTVDYRPDRQLHVVCVGLPALGNAKAWTDEYTVTFRAYEQPYWESVTEKRAAAEATESAAMDMHMPGTMATVLDADVQNVSGGTISTVQISANGCVMRLEELGMAPGETLRIRHDGGLLALMISAADGTERSVYNKRTSESHDEVLLVCGRNIIGVTADAACNWTIRARGRWL